MHLVGNKKTCTHCTHFVRCATWHILSLYNYSEIRHTISIPPPTLKLFAHAPALSWWKSLQTPASCTESELAVLLSEFQFSPLFMSAGWNGLTPATFNYCARCSASFATSFSIMYHCIHCVSTCTEENIDFFLCIDYSSHSNRTLTQLGVVQLSIHRACLDLLCLKSGAFGFRLDDLLSHQSPGFSK